MNVIASAPGKLVVSGEYAVLAGAPALVLAVERRMRVSLRAGRKGWSFESSGFTGASHHAFSELLSGPAVPREDPAALPQHVLRELASTGHGVERLPVDLEIVIDSRAGYEAGTKLGLGSSAAVAVAFSAALLAGIGAPTTAALPVARAAHTRLQKGRGSGLDVAAAYYGGLIRFTWDAALGAISSESPPAVAPTSAGIDRLRSPEGVHWLPIWTRASADTSDSLARFDAWRGDATPRALAHLVDASRTVAHAVGEGSVFVRELRRYTARLIAFDAAAGLGIATPAHRYLLALAGDAVAYKPCGAGGGDLGIACAEDSAALEAFGVAAARAGYPPLRMEVARHGVDVSITR